MQIWNVCYRTDIRRRRWTLCTDWIRSGASSTTTSQRSSTIFLRSRVVSFDIKLYESWYLHMLVAQNTRCTFAEKQDFKKLFKAIVNVNIELSHSLHLSAPYSKLSPCIVDTCMATRIRHEFREIYISLQNFSQIL